MKEYARQFYLGKAWKKVSGLYMESKHHICERCGAPAKICHHKKYITPANIHDPEITLNMNNLECLCQDCHNKEHFQKYSKALFDDDGNMYGTKDSAELEEYKNNLSKLERIVLELEKEIGE